MTPAPTLTVLLVLAAAAPGQSLLLGVGGAAPDGEAGRAASGAGDLDLDGYDDVVVGAPGAGGTGAVSVHSGQDGSVLWSVAGTAPGERFGICATGLGDVDEDGVPDVVVGSAPDDGAGGVRILSGQDGTVLRAFGGAQDGELFGFVVDAIDDLDGDGVDDVVVGAPDWNGETGRVAIHSGRTGAVLVSLPGSEPGARFGIAASRTGDLDGDGRDDLVVGALQAGDQQQGDVFVYALGEGGVATELFVLTGEPNMHNGGAVSDCGDVDGDGVPDVVAGGYFWESKTGAATVYSGADGSLVHFWTGDEPGQLFGTSVTGFADVDDDGRADVLVGSVGNAGGEGPGLVQVFCGRTGAELYRLALGDPGAQLGLWADAAGDLDADGTGDVVAGAPFSSAVARDGGFAVALSGSPWRDLGQGLAGTGGIPRLAGSGLPAPDAPVALALEDAAPSSPVVFVVSATTSPVPFLGGVLVPAPTLALEGVTGADGGAVIATPWPDLLPLTEVYVQAWAQDGGGPAGFSASNALQATTLAPCEPDDG